MSNNLGTGVSRVLDPTHTGYTEVIWQQGRPPCDAELNLLQEIATDWQRKAVLSGTPSGWLGNETNSSDVFVTNSMWSNWFQFGQQRAGEKRAVQWARVNGWLVPVVGTKTGTPPGSPNDTSTWNLVTLDPPPANSGDFRVDYVFLEVWLARIPPNPETLNKPSAAAIYKYGNVEGGASFIADDLVDPALGFDTTQRVQLQYRVRVVKGLVGLANYPDGFDPVVVKAQGAASSPTSYTFANMRTELGDAGLWRAGDGTANALGTVDGYVYAIPMCSVFRRNSVAWTGDPSQNFNGGFNRNPTAVDRTGYKTFSTTGGVTDTVPAIPTLATAISSSVTSFTISPLGQLNYFPLPLSPSTPVLIQVGDELMSYSSITTGGLMTVTRGVNGTRAEAHASGSPIIVLSGRPDGLFSDQVARTDILDMRHEVNPNGFDYDSLLKSNLDKLLKGTLRANWKRTGYGPQGTYLNYQDKIGASAGSGVTKLDTPDNIRMVYSDSVAIQPVEFIAVAGSTTGTPTDVTESWSLSLTINATQSVAGQFTAGDILSIPILQFKTGLPGGDSDQVRFANESLDGIVELRIDGETTPISTSQYTVTPSSPTASNDLTITLGGSFPTVPDTKRLYVKVHVLYGPGRGLSRRPDAINSIAFNNVSAEVLVHHSGVVANNFPLKTGWAALWSKFRSAAYRNLLPVTTESYADLGSRTIVLQPFRRILWPSILTMDGTAANYNPTSYGGTTTGVASGAGNQFTDSAGFVFGAGMVGHAIVVQDGVQPGRYNIVSVSAGAGPVGYVVLDRQIPAASGLTWTIHTAQGLMPLLKRDNVTPKWSLTDPLEVFSGQGETAASTKNIYINLPRHLMPGWGEFRLPLITTYDETQNPNFAEGVNYGFISLKGSSYTDSDKNYVPYRFSSGALSYAVFSTWNFTGGVTATYNTAFGSLGITMAGIRKFTDTRGLSRKGLELPPFYGIARLFAVYERVDYSTNGSAYQASNRQPATGGATNLLRQSFDGPLFWVEIDDDGDSTFILNADALDLSRSPNPVVFDTGNFVIEASIFGFDRDAFDLTKECRIVMTRPINTATSRNQAVDAVIRANNIGEAVSGPYSVLPGPALATGVSAVINYSRTPYMGDPWGSQTSYMDLSQNVGPLQSATAYQIASTELDLSLLTRPNQKLLEVLASCGFSTTMGTGRLTGDSGIVLNLDIRGAGWEDPAVYPPGSGIAARPLFYFDAFESETATVEAGSDYLGCTERLPMGALFRDKDFRGGTWGWNMPAPFVHTASEGLGKAASLGMTLPSEGIEVPLGTASTGSGQAGEYLVHVDGEPSNYSLLTNFRVYRGGSVFTASGPRPGGEVVAYYPNATAPAGHTNVLHGRAFLVRNTVTSVGATEASAGDELMLLIVTTAQQYEDMNAHESFVGIGTNGSWEGYSAADLYRIEGRPLINDNVRPEIDPSAIDLPQRSA